MTDLEAHIPAVRRYARALNRRHEAADDLVQDCLERAITGWHLRRKGTSTRAWLLTIMRNLFLTGLRRNGRQPTTRNTKTEAVSPPMWG